MGLGGCAVGVHGGVSRMCLVDSTRTLSLSSEAAVSVPATAQLSPSFAAQGHQTQPVTSDAAVWLGFSSWGAESSHICTHAVSP